MEPPMPAFIRIRTHTSVRMTTAGFGALSDGTPRLRNQVAASIMFFPYKILTSR